MRRRQSILLFVLLLATLPIGGLVYGCVHYYMLMYHMNHVQDRGPTEDRYEWTFTAFVISTTLSLVVYAIAWKHFFDHLYNDYELVLGPRRQFESIGSTNATETGDVSLVQPYRYDGHHNGHHNGLSDEAVEVTL